MSPPAKSNNGWSQYEKLILDKLDTHGKILEDLAEEIKELRDSVVKVTTYEHRIEKLEEASKDTQIDIGKIYNRITGLQFKSGVWGLIAGAIPVLVIVILYLVFVP